MNFTTEAQLKKDLKSGVFRRLYVVFGEDTLLKQLCVKNIEKHSVNGVLPDMNLSVISGKGLKMQTLMDETDQLPVMSPKRCVVVTDFDAETLGKTESEEFKTILSDLPETTVLVFYCDTVEINIKKLSKWKDIFAIADKTGYLVNCAYKSESELVKIVCTMCKSRSCGIEPPAARYLVEVCARDLQKIKSETEKLCSYANGENITKETIDMLSVKTLNATKYQLPKLIVEMKTAMCFEIISDLLDMRVEPIEISSGIISAFIDLYRLKIAFDASKSISSLASDFGYRGREFVLNNFAPYAKKLNINQLRKCLDVLFEADEKLKMSADDSRIILEQAVIMLTEIMRGKI